MSVRDPDARPTPFDRYQAMTSRHPERVSFGFVAVVAVGAGVALAVAGVPLWFVLSLTTALLVLVGGGLWLFFRLMRRRGLIPTTVSAEQVAQNRRVARAVRRGEPLPIDAARRDELLAAVPRDQRTMRVLRWVFVGVAVLNVLNGVSQALSGSWVMAGFLFVTAVGAAIGLALVPRFQRRYVAALRAHPDPPRADRGGQPGESTDPDPSDPVGPQAVPDGVRIPPGPGRGGA